jgi:cyanate permease
VSSIIGTLYSAAAIGNLAGPWLAGRIFDASGSYAAVTWGCIVLSALSTLCTWRAVRR